MIHESLSNNLHFGVQNDFEFTVRLTQTVDRWYSQDKIQQKIMVFVLVQDEIAWLQFARFKDLEGFYGFIRAFEGFCGLEQVFQGILASWNRNHNICNIQYNLSDWIRWFDLDHLRFTGMHPLCTLYTVEILKMYRLSQNVRIRHLACQRWNFAFWRKSLLICFFIYQFWPIIYFFNVIVWTQAHINKAPYLLPYNEDEHKLNLYRP